MVPCPVGFYQPLPVQESCWKCPERFLCEPAAGPPAIGAIKPVICDAGYYCQENSDKKKCPIGTYSDMTGLASPEECFPCPVGKACTVEGLNAPDEECAAGYYCIEKAKSPNTVESKSVEECGKGYYCDHISPIPLPCPPGTYSDSTRLESVDDCKPCPKRFYCPYRAGTSTMYKFTTDEFKCAPGYLCLSGSSTPIPKDGTKGVPCKEGTYCLKGAEEEIPCPENTYNPYVGQGACHKCPLGKHCPDLGMFEYEKCV
jgi:hypothetical protein